MEWSVQADGIEVSHGKLPIMDIPAHQRANIAIDYKVKPEAGKEYFVTLSVKQREERNLIPAGHELAFAQFKLPFDSQPKEVKLQGKLSLDRGNDIVTISGSKFSVVFDTKKGLITHLVNKGEELLYQGKGLEPNFWRAPIDNDFGNGLDVRCKVWRKAGANRKVVSARVKKVNDRQVNVLMKFELPGLDGKSVANYESLYKILASGDIIVENDFKATAVKLPEIPRMGMNMQLKREFDNMAWLGRGPQESYWDRKSGAKVGFYQGKVKD